MLTETQDALASTPLAVKLLAQRESRDVLRLMICGSVDDGKSTLFGRLLNESPTVPEDRTMASNVVSNRYSTTGDENDPVSLLDGLQAEHEQGISIDLAYGGFETNKRKCIVAYTQDPQQNLYEMAPCPFYFDLAVILVDARTGVLQQPLRQTFIASLIGLRHVVFAVNKIDLTDFSQEAFLQVAEEYKSFVARFEFETTSIVPISALYGDNVSEQSERLPWYHGPTFLSCLENVDVCSTDRALPFRFPVQSGNQQNVNFRGFSGTVASGNARKGDEVVVTLSGKTSTIKSIVLRDGERLEVGAGEAATLMLEDEIDISRGDLLSPANHRPLVTDQISAYLTWMDRTHMLMGRPYLIRIGSQLATATVTALKHKVNLDDLHHYSSAKTLEIGDIGFCNLAFSQPLAMDTYEDNRRTGSFVLIDRLTNQTVAAGLVWFGLRRAENVHWQAVDLDKATRAAQKQQTPKVLWFTGLSGSGKSTIANLVEKKLHAKGHHTYLLDGDNVRHGLSRDLGFTDIDRVENIRRIGEVSKLMLDAGLIVLTAFISPYAAERRMVRELLDEGEFVEIFVETSLEVCERRDVKGLYAKARDGEIKNFTGIDAPYEAPATPEILVNTESMTVEQSAEKIIEYLTKSSGDV